MTFLSSASGKELTALLAIRKTRESGLPHLLKIAVPRRQRGASPVLHRALCTEPNQDDTMETHMNWCHDPLIPNRDIGTALLTVVAVLTIIGVLAAAMTGDTRGHIHRISDLGDSAKIEAALDGALAVGVYGLVQASTHPDAIRSRYIRVGSYIVTFAVRPEASKLDLNAAPESSLAALFHAAGASDAQATALAAEAADWRDEDDLVRPNGAEFRDYAQRGSSSRPSNTRFQTVAELANLLSMNQTIFDCVQPYVTVYAQRAQIDAYYAAPFLTRALDLSMPTTEEGQAIVTPLSPALGDVFEVTARVTLARPSMRRSKRWIVRFVGSQKDPYWILDIDSPGPIEAASNAACPRSVSNQG